MIRFGGEKCACGRRGCFEAYASATAFIRQTRRAMEKDRQSKLWDLCGGDIANVNGKTIFDGSRAGDITAKKVVNAYIDERAKKFGTFSYDALTTDEFNGEDILVDTQDDPSVETEHRIMIDMLLKVFRQLTDDEQSLLKALYFEGLSEREYAARLGVYPNAVHKRKVRILEKLKKLIGN